MKVIAVLTCMLFSSFWCYGQNVLDAVYYMNDPEVRNGDTLWAKANVTVIDSLSKKPLKDITVEIFGSDGTSLSVKSNEIGFVSYRIKISNKYKLVCSSEMYDTKMWELSTINISYPIKFDATIELVKKKK